MQRFLWVPIVLVLVGLTPIRAPAFDTFLDYNTDGDLETFLNLATGPVTVPVDLVLVVEPGEVGQEFRVSTVLSWEYGGQVGEDPACYETYGKVDWSPLAIPTDIGPFHNVFAQMCLCIARCHCAAQVLIEFDVVNVPAPGNYLLATLDFSRTAYLCGENEVWPQAAFQWICSFGCAHPDDPRTRFMLRENAVAAPFGMADETWAETKSSYR